MSAIQDGNITLVLVGSHGRVEMCAKDQICQLLTTWLWMQFSGMKLAYTRETDGEMR